MNPYDSFILTSTTTTLTCFRVSDPSGFLCFLQLLPSAWGDPADGVVSSAGLRGGDVVQQADYLYESGETEKLYQLLVQYKDR